MKIIGVIPARLASTRLREKVLRPIAGRPMIEYVYRRAKEAKRLNDVIVACDDARVEDCVKNFGGKAMRTRTDHPNGSSRAAEAARRLDAEILINIQGDEPLIHPENIDRLADVLLKDPEIQIATLAVRKKDIGDFQSPHIVKVVCDLRGQALYFSRSPIPYFRDGLGAAQSYLKHLGIYGYRRKFLLNFTGWKPGVLEDCEKLEQLRVLENGVPLRVVETPHDSWSVDTEEDLRVVEKKLQEQVV